jgi:hypothetical protein
MRTQEEIELLSLQKHLRDAFILAKFMSEDKVSDLIEKAFKELSK